jgi:hypothetical protein
MAKRHPDFMHRASLAPSINQVGISLLLGFATRT